MKKNQSVLVAILISAFLLFLSQVETAEKKPIGDLDLFGYQASQMKAGLNQRSEDMMKAFARRLGKPEMTKILSQAGYSGNLIDGLCLKVDKNRYALQWKNSETEGMILSLESVEGPNCPKMEFSEKAMPETSLPMSKFQPISARFPEVQIGSSTPESIQRSFGKPSAATKSKLTYILERDYEKEKTCYGKVGDGPIASIEVDFTFFNGVLKTIEMINGIAGEC